MQVIVAMGAWIEQKWRALHFDNEVFPSLAVEALETFQPSLQIDRKVLFDWCLEGDGLPLPVDANSHFGQPPLTLLRKERFYIEAYYWLDGTTSIHAHSFSGAFQVLEGLSLHSRYTFATARRWSEHFETGALALTQQELLRESDIRAIDGGRAGIHAVFHLARPSLSLVIRSDREPEHMPQYTYYPPHVADHRFYQPALLKRRLDLIETHLRIEPDETITRLQERLPTCDILEQFRTLSRVCKALPERPDLWAPLLQSLETWHPEHGRLLSKSLREESRRDNIMARRMKLTKTTHRLLLGLLTLCEERTQILALLSAFSPTQAPLELLFAILWDIASLDDSAGSLGFPLTPVLLLSLEAILQEIPENERAEWVMKQCQERTHKCSPREVQKALFKVPYIPILKSLFV